MAAHTQADGEAARQAAEAAPQPTAGEAARGEEAARDEVVIPVLRETVHIGKRRVESGRVRVHKTVSERDEPVEVVLKRQDLEVERVPIGRVVDQAPAPREEAGTLIVPVIEEVVVVEKRLMLKEELHIRRKNTERTVRETVRLRAETASVEHVPAPMAPTDPADPSNRSDS